MRGKRLLKKYRKLIVFISSLVILLAIGGIYKSYRKYVQANGSKFKIETKIDVITETGISQDQVHSDDTYLVLTPELIDSWVLGDVQVYPGKYVSFTNNQGKSSETLKTKSFEEEYQEAKILLYDLNTKKLAKIFDIMPWIDKQKNWYYKRSSYWYISGENETQYIKVSFFEKPVKDEKTNEYKNGYKAAELFYDIETEETNLFEWTKHPDGRYRSNDINASDAEEEEWWKLINEVDWFMYRKDNKFEGISTTGFWEEEWKKAKPRYFDVSCYYDVNGFVEINLSSNALPKENAGLYQRFPELKKYATTDKYHPVKIYLGGHLTQEEIEGLFVDESK